MEKLPGICHPEVTVEKIRALWPDGAKPAEEAPVEDWINYPWNGLFPHPLNEGPPIPGAVPKRNAA